MLYQEWEPRAFGPLLHVTYLCLQGLLGPKSYIPPLEVVYMMECYRVCPILWLGEMTWLMMGNSSCKATWWPMIKPLVSELFLKRIVMIFRGWIQNFKGLPCDLPIGTFQSSNFLMCHWLFKHHWICWIIRPKWQSTWRAAWTWCRTVTCLGPH